ncbi:hypothetical protein Dsin_002427 [Dipteronia sinensis]|uniref:Uncharacterized protein n=1 Tax=Dipteronia sinensis TaxID=43782 RepID=A0AAE0B5R4_9ROSI|nr:hypothetical protein Dsin_002427 [Dipteronia sinensis]
MGINRGFTGAYGLGCVNLKRRELIKRAFSSDDDGAILQIPTGSSRSEDAIIWHYEDNEWFSVKNGYWVGHTLENNPSSSNYISVEAWWKSLWKLSIPLKIKSLSGRLAMTGFQLCLTLAMVECM